MKTILTFLFAASLVGCSEPVVPKTAIDAFLLGCQASVATIGVSEQNEEKTLTITC